MTQKRVTIFVWVEIESPQKFNEERERERSHGPPAGALNVHLHAIRRPPPFPVYYTPTPKMLSFHSCLLPPNLRLPPLLRRPIDVEIPSFSLWPPKTIAFRCGNSGMLMLDTPPAATAMNGVSALVTEAEMDRFAAVANAMADAAGVVIRKYFRQSFEILDKEDLSPVTIADREAEESMISIIMEIFPTHAVFGEEKGWRCKEKSADFVWVLDPIDGTKSFITGKPLFGTLIALLYKGKPIVGIIDQPVLRERWIGLNGKRTTLNGHEICTRPCSKLSQAYLYTSSPHIFSGEDELAFSRVRDKVKVSLYGCDCYAYALLASGFVDLVIESGLKPYDFLSLVPVIEGAGGSIMDWKGNKLHWEPSPDSRVASFNVVAVGDPLLLKQASEVLNDN